MVPDQAKAIGQTTMLLKTQLEELEQLYTMLETQVDNLIGQYSGVNKEVRERRAKAKAIEDAVYDLKAINPNSQVEEDTRTRLNLSKLSKTKAKKLPKHWRC